ncbi:MAG TPA: coenzyme F420-0:L-glutamate ligase [bacterium]|nr:coenzyme F420-0:L-glutamate ligase [bacterium]
MRTLTAWVPEGFPDVRPGTDLAAAIRDVCRAAGLELRAGDVLVLAHKVVSKAEGAVVHLAEVVPTPRAERLAVEAEKDPRLCQVILDESAGIVRVRPGLIIAEHRLGFICANAAVDFSNVGLGGDWVCVLPKDPTASAERIRRAVAEATGVSVAVIINDTHGRPWREGAVGVAIGTAGLEPIYSYVGREDRYGYVLHSSIESVADELAAAASLLQGQAAEGTPLVVIRGARYDAGGGRTHLLREPDKDMFR